MRIAITGGRGRVAPLLAGDFRARGFDVVIFSRSASPGVEGIENFGPGFDVVIHCAWNCVPYTAEQDPRAAETGNLPFMESLLERAGNAQFVFLSTGAVYGNTGSEPAREESPPNPLGAYARGKLAAEETLRAQRPERHLILRTTNLLIPCTTPERPQGVVPRIVAAARSKRPVEIWGDGTSTKDYLSYDDFAEALHAAFDAHASGTFNLGSGESLSLLELIRLLECTIGCTLERRFLPHFPWDVTTARIAIDKFCHATGWSPREPLRPSITRFLQAL